MAKTVKTRGARVSGHYQALDVLDLSGGLDLRRAPTNLHAQRAVWLENFSLTAPGELPVRAGYRQFTSSSLGAKTIQGAQRVYLSDTAFTVAAYDGGLYLVDDTGGIGTTAVYSTLSSAASVYFPYDRVMVAAMDSTNRPRKSTDGSTWTRMGIDRPILTSTVSTVGSGSLSSAIEYEFSFTYKHRGTGHESNESTTVSTVTPGSTGAVSLQLPNSSDAQVDALVVYGRNKTAGETVRRRASSAAASAGASSTLVITSSNWSANDEAPTNHHPPGGLAFGVIWKNRWWAKSGSVGNRLHFTEIFQPESWPALFYIDIPFERGDEITLLVTLGDALIVFGQSKPFVIIGQTSLDFEVRPAPGAQAGALGARAGVAIEHGVIHASAEGVWLFDGADDRYLSLDIEPAWRNLIQHASAATLAQIAVVYQFAYKELRVGVSRRWPITTAGEWVLDLNRTREQEAPAWTTTDRDIRGYVLHDGDESVTGVRGRLLTWPAAANGALFEESTGLSANSSNLTATYEGPHLPMGRHMTRIIDVSGEYDAATGTLSIEPYVDGISQGVQPIVMPIGGSVYDSAIYDGGLYDGKARSYFTVTQPLGADGRTCWVKMVYSGQARFSAFTYAFGVVPESAARGFSD